MGRPERPLDPTAGPLEAFAVDLRELRNAAGKASYRSLAQRAGFSPSVLSAATSGFSLPTLRVTLGLVSACGGDLEEWTRRWHAVARQVQGTGHSAVRRPAGALASRAGGPGSRRATTQADPGRRPGIGEANWPDSGFVGWSGADHAGRAGGDYAGWSGDRRTAESALHPPGRAGAGQAEERSADPAHGRETVLTGRVGGGQSGRPAHSRSGRPGAGLAGTPAAAHLPHTPRAYAGSAHPGALPPAHQQAVLLHPAQLHAAVLPRPAQLPVTSVRLVGRAGETAHLSALSNRSRRNGRAPILISGAIGTGKSVTAMHWCHRNAAQFPDGVLYTDLAQDGPDAAPDVLTGFLLALGTTAEQIPVNPVHRAALYRSMVADRRMLILLDNAADEAQVRLLLATTPGSQVLITSRSRMAGLDGVERMVLETMPPEQSVSLLGAIVGHDQVAAQLKAALEVAAFCDHLPVALRAIGTRIAVRRGWTLRHAASQLRDERHRVDYLAAGHPGLRESFRIAHRGLHTDDRQMLMRVIRLHQTEFDVPAPVGGPKLPVDQIEEALERLVDAGLLQPAGASGRYRLPVLFRLLSLEMLRSAPPVAAKALQAAG